MIINAKFASVCPCCSAPIAVGSKIEWSKGAKAVHVACAGRPPVATSAAATPTAARRTARPGRWTGCSCGSREYSNGVLIPSSRNCSSCEFDA